MSIITGVGSPGTVSSASGGKVYAYNGVSEVVQLQVAPANTARKKIIFHNPGASDFFIIPQFVQTTGSNVANGVTTSLLGGAFRVFANGGSLEIEGECQGAWFALAVSGAGSSNPITIMDSNV